MNERAFLNITEEYRPWRRSMVYFQVLIQNLWRGEMHKTPVHTLRQICGGIQLIHFFSGNSQVWSNHHGHVLLVGVCIRTSLLGNNLAASCKVGDTYTLMTEVLALEDLSHTQGYVQDC